MFFVFVEGEDFNLLAAFSRKLGYNALANRTSFAVVGANGFNPSRVADFSDGMQATLGVSIKRAVVFDRDYRPAPTVARLKSEFEKTCDFVWIHQRKELENFLLVPAALERAIIGRINDKKSRGGKAVVFCEDMLELISKLTEEMKSDVFGQCIASGVKAISEVDRSVDSATASALVHKELDARWASLDERLKVVPGKALLSKLNDVLQERYGVSVTTNSIVSAMHVSDIPDEMRQLVLGLAAFAKS